MFSDHDKSDTPEEAEKMPVRKPTIWPMEDKDLFFEAVNEYGKDFLAIQRYFVIKNKNKDGNVRTKEQIRRFYYRTWAKIAPKLHFPPRELYFGFVTNRYYYRDSEGTCSDTKTFDYIKFIIIVHIRITSSN